MAKWGEIKCERCAALEERLEAAQRDAKEAEAALAENDALWEGMERALEESDAREARLEAKLDRAVEALRGWIDFANAEGMPVLLSDLEAAELTGEGDE